MFDIYTSLNEIQADNNAQKMSEFTNSVVNHCKNNPKHIINVINIFLLQGKKANSNRFLHVFTNLIEEFSTTEDERNDSSEESEIKDSRNNMNNYILNEILNHLQNTIDSKNKNVRRNTLTLLNILFKNLEPEQDFIVYLCERLYDKEKEVVKKAVLLLAKYQNVKINKKDSVFNAYKDLLKHDPNGDIRRLVLKNIEITDRTINAVIEKVVDRDIAVRNVFYKQILEKIKLKDLAKEKVEFLVQKCLQERDFDYKDIFTDKIIMEYNFADNTSNFLSFVNKHEIESMKDFLWIVFAKINMKFDTLPKDCNQAKVYNIYLDYIENKEGRDYLKLENLNNYIEYILQVQNDPTFTLELLQTLRFYDFVTEEEKNQLKLLFQYMLTKELPDEISNFIFSMIKKYLEFDFDLSEVCDKFYQYIFKYKLYGDNFDYYLNKVKAQNSYASLLCLFYLCKNDMNFEPPAQLIKCKDLNLLTDLFISYKNNNCEKEDIIRKEIDILIYKGIKTGDTDVMVPIMKLFISKFVQDNELLAFIMQNYYTDLDDHLYQYTTLFFYEYNKNDATPIIDLFVSTFLRIQNKKVLVNQTLFWIKNSLTVNGLQKLCYNICLSLLNEDLPKKNVIELISVLNQIECTIRWDADLTKRILFCAGLIIKKIETKTLLNNFIGKLIVVDDGIPLDKEVIQEYLSK